MTEQAGETATITAVIRDYLDGMVFADAAKLRRAFDPRSFVIGYYGSVLEWSSREEFITMVEKQGSAPKGEKYYSDIVSIDIVGDIASAKVVDDYRGDRYTDYLSFLKQDGEWVIVNKTYYRHPKT